MAGLTDFNDLHVLHGNEKGLLVVRSQIVDAVERFRGGVESSPPPSECVPEYECNSFSCRESESPTPSFAREMDVELYDLDGRYSLPTLLGQFWYVYNTDTVWDNVNRLQMRLSHLRHCVGKDRYKGWDTSAQRKTVFKIAFEPGRDLGADHVNLWDGIKMQPDARGHLGCMKIIEHLYKLCRNREEEFEWLVRWIAYPLKHPGAKMASSVIMYGSEGPGKSIVWEKVVKAIYGEYGVTIGQAQLDSQFTGWQSKKQFAVAEEVVARTERSHHKGMLKHLVTGDTLMINEKNLPEHEETNHINFVFLSNSTVPLELDMGDRRYMVLYVNEVPSQEYFDDLYDEIKRGGVECFYQYLLKIDLAGFSPHTKPPVNEEKVGLINSSLPSPVYFYRLWEAGELDIPFRSAVASDLYKAFQRWCDQNGEFKRTSRYFGQELQRVMPQVRKNIRYPCDDSIYTTKRIYVTPGDMKLEHDEGFVGALSESCRVFWRSLDKSE